MDRDWAAVFTETFGMPVSAVEARIWSDVYGDEYPAELQTFSYLTRSELARFERELQLRPEALLVEVGCGRGGPGLWVALRSGARLVGLDIAASAVAAAEQHSLGLGLGGRAEFRVGTFEDTGLPDGAADGVMSVDALLFTPDKAAALRELARILRPGGRLVFTTWDYHRQPSGRPPQVPDHRPLLEAAGFEVLAYDEPAGWHEQMGRVGEQLLEASDELAAERGTDPAQTRAGIEEMNATLDCVSRRVFAVAQLRSWGKALSGSS